MMLDFFQTSDFGKEEKKGDHNSEGNKSPLTETLLTTWKGERLKKFQLRDFLFFLTAHGKRWNGP